MGLADLAVILVAGFAAAALIVLMRPLSARYALARPNARSSHKAPTPQGGGVAVVLGGFIALVAVALLGQAQGLAALAPLGAAVALLMGLGVVDDIRSLPALPRLALQAVAVITVVASMPAELRALPIVPLLVERSVEAFALLWFVNLVNFMDGIDWITVAETVPVAAGVYILSLFGAVPQVPALVALALLGAVLGFAPFNRPVAKLFLGDGGSLPIGLVMGWLLLQLAGNGHLAAALLLPLYYVADATITLARRWARGERIMRGPPQPLLPDRDGARLLGDGRGQARVRGEPHVGVARGGHGAAQFGGVRRDRARSSAPARSRCCCGRWRGDRDEGAGHRRVRLCRPRGGGCARRRTATKCTPRSAGPPTRQMSPTRTSVSARRHCRAATATSMRASIGPGCSAGIDAVVHLAGIAHAGPGVAEERYDRVNHRATAALAVAAHDAGVSRFVFVSSIRAQTGPAAERVVSERDTPRPTDAYGRSKLAAERAVAASGVPFTILRPVLVYGPGVKGNLRALMRLAALPIPLPFGGA